MNDIVERLKAHCTTRYKDTVQTDLLEAIDEIERLRAEIDQINEATRAAIADKCGVEKHCSCVPLLKREIELLRAKIDRALEVGGKPDAARDNIIAELKGGTS